MVQRRDDTQRALDSGRIAPEARESTQGLVDLMSRQIGAARRASSLPATGEPGSAPANEAPSAPPATERSGETAATAPEPPAGEPPARTEGNETRQEGTTPTAPGQPIAEGRNPDVSPGSEPAITRPPTTFESVQGEKLDGKRTAFHPDSGTLGIPRDQMPQVAVEHRGAMANFLNARGMQVSEAVVAPQDLQPSQADFNPGKVRKAAAIREAGEVTPRRILVSSDGKVVDGHHQWLDRLRHAPGEPIQTLRINAPARDILGQMHEFPSAGMARKIPDIGEDGLAVGDQIDLTGKGMRYTLTEDKGAKVVLRTPSGKSLTVQRKLALAKKMTGAPPTQPAPAATSAPSTPAVSAAAVPRARDGLAVGDTINVMSAGKLVPHTLTADQGARVVLTAPDGTVRQMDRAMARHRKVVPPTPDAPAPVSETPAPEPSSALTPRARVEAPAQPSDTANERKARAWIADQRAAGRDFPTAGAVTKANFVNYNRAVTLVGEQVKAEQQAAQPSGKAVSASPPREVPDLQAPAAPLPRSAAEAPAKGNQADADPAKPRAGSAPLQPATEIGRSAARRIGALEAKRTAQNGFLSPGERNSLADSRQIVDADLNRQALGPHPKPTSAYGIHAADRLDELNGARVSGAQLSRSQHAEIRDLRAVLENDFTRQRLALDARGQASAPAPKPPVSGERVVTPVVKGESVVRSKARQWLADQRAAGKQPTAYRMAQATGLPPEPAQALLDEQADLEHAAQETLTRAHAHVADHADTLEALGIHAVRYGDTTAGSGVEMGEDGTLRIAPSKLARTLDQIQANQTEHPQLASHPEDAFLQTLAHEAVHAADFAVARAKGQTIEERYAALPDGALPKGWEQAASEIYGARNWDGLQGWQKKAEFVRQVVEGRWTGRVSEQLYKFIRDAIEYLKSIAGFKNVDARFRTHVEEVEARIQSRQAKPPQPDPFRRPSRAAVAEQSRRTRLTQKAAEGNPANDGLAARYQAERAKLSEMQRLRALPLQEGETPRTFEMATAPTGHADVLDHIAEQGGLVSPKAAREKPTFSKYARDYDGAPTLGGYYHHAVYGGAILPDRMAQILHESYGVSDGSADGMWKAIDQAIDLRRTVSARRGSEAKQEAQAGRFDKEAVTEGTAKGQIAVHVGDLAPGDTLRVNGEELTVKKIDPDTLDVTLSDHERYGVQKVGPGTVVYVQQVQEAVPLTQEGNSVFAPRPESLRDTGTPSLFASEQDDGFALRPTPSTPAERLAAAKRETSTFPLAELPRLRRGERQGDLLANQAEDLTLVGEKGIDHAARQAEAARAEREKAEARAKQDREQQSLFGANPAATAGVRNTGKPGTLQTARAAWKALGVNSPFFKAWFGDWKKSPATASRAVDARGKPLVLLHGTNAAFDAFDPQRGEHSREQASALGIHLTEAPEYSAAAVAKRTAEAGGSGRVMRLYADARRPLDLGPDAEATPFRLAEMPRAWQERFEDARAVGAKGESMLSEALAEDQAYRLDQVRARLSPRETSELVQAMGYDSIVSHPAGLAGKRNWIVFRPEQVKSAEPAGTPGSNSGAFDSRDTRTVAAPTVEPIDENNGGGERAPDPSRAPNVFDLVKEATGENATTRKRYAVYGTVSPEQAAALKAATGLDLAGYRRNLDNSTVRHVLREHGDLEAERARGNLPLSKDDFARLTQWIKQPDASVLAGKNSRGQDVILHAKRINGHVVVAEEVRDTRGILSLSTLYKKSAPPLASGPDGKPDAALLQGTARATLDQVARDFKFKHGQGDPGTAAAGKVEPILESDGDAGTEEPAAPSTPPTLVARAKARVQAHRELAALRDKISAGFDTARNLPGYASGQAKSRVRYDLPDPLDRQAARAVVEAGYDPKRLQEDLAGVEASPNKKLAAEYGPAFRHALANLPRLREATADFREMQLQEDAAAEAAGLPPSWQKRVARVQDDPLSPESTLVPESAFLGVKGARTSAARLIAKGIDPGTLDLAEAAESLVRRNRQAISNRAFQEGLASLKASDGKPIVGEIVETGERLGKDGGTVAEQRVPKGYVAVQAGSNLLTVHRQFAPLLQALYGESAFDRSAPLRLAKDVSALAKHGTAILDSYHGFKVLYKELFGFQTVGYDRGLSTLELSDRDLARAVAAGDYSQAEADWARANRPTVERGLHAGLNVDGMSDNLLEAARQHNLIGKIPVLGPVLTKVNDLIFRKLSRGAMVQAYVVAEARNRARSLEKGEAEIARQSAKEVNEFFGNLGSQGSLKSRTMRDAANVIFFAPSWTESTARSEARGIGQAVKGAADGLRGKGWRLGVVAQAVGGTVLAALVANQALNLFTRGQPTWENPEDGHGWDAWISGGAHDKGFWLSPLSIAAEYSHALHKYLEAGESPVDAVAHIVANKLSGPARAAKELATGEDYAGRPFSSMGERLTAAATDLLPSPMPLGSLIRKDPRAPLGYRFNHEPGALKKQAFASAGLKLDPAQGARGQMYGIAEAFRSDKPVGTAAPHAASVYGDLRHSLDNGDEAGAEAEVRRLLGTGKHLSQIEHFAAGIASKPGKGPLRVAPELFTGKKDSEQRMLAKLTPEQRKVYDRAQADRKENAQLLGRIGERLRRDMVRRGDEK